MFEALPQAPQSLGDIVGRSFRLFRCEFRSIIRIFLWPTLISTGSLAGIRFCAAYWLGLTRFDWNSLFFVLALCTLLVGVLCMAQWEESIRAAALARLALRLDDQYKEAYALAKKRKWSILLAYFVAFFLPSSVLVFWGTGIVLFMTFSHKLVAAFSILTPIVLSLDGFLLTITFSWACLFSAMLFSVIACEDVTFAQMFSRSFDLTVPYLWRGGSFMVLLIICAVGFFVALDLPLILANAYDIHSHGAAATQLAYQPPMYVHILIMVSDTLTSLFSVGVLVIAGALYYYDLRMRMEGQDLLRRLDKFTSS